MDDSSSYACNVHAQDDQHNHNTALLARYRRSALRNFFFLCEPLSPLASLLRVVRLTHRCGVSLVFFLRVRSILREVAHHVYCFRRLL